MTRPQIVRADTLDLQDKTSPTAQDHSNQPAHPAPLGIGPAAPHQEASLRRVEDERSDEEARLVHGARPSADGLRDEPASDDESTVAVNGNAGDNAAVRLNGGMSGESGESDDHDMQDADVEEDLDDMDRISSSPSISDGGLPFHYSAPRRQEPGFTLSRGSSPVASLPLSLTWHDSSSPFTQTPAHFPLFVAAARRPHRVPAGTASRAPQPPYRPPTPLPSFSQCNQTPQPADHHRGEYTRPRIVRDKDHEYSRDKEDCTFSPITELHLSRLEDRLQHMCLDPLGSLTSESDDDPFSRMLEPVLDPLLHNVPEEDPFYDHKRSSYRIPKRTSSLLGSYTQKESRCDGTDQPIQTSANDEEFWTDDSDADSWDATSDYDDDDLNGVSLPSNEHTRFVDSGWGGECLREVEDIDFEFVYSLHTFVATVEGQANATKGDTMVLLDDSNSYWWLVRVVKDNSIGYLPAEHIETPTERLARLNKHRNIDLSATMLGDTAEKTKNPLKKAMRRRNAKTVQFTQPQYFEPSDYDYSSDEDDGDELFGGADPSQAQAQQQQVTNDRNDSEQDDNLKVQPLKLNGGKKELSGKPEAELNDLTEDSARGGAEKQRSSDESFDKPLDPKVSRNGTMRNTDSFFKDENTETRKITLTPNLLRDDSSTSTTGSRERGPSLESLEKNGFADKVKDDKRKKDKKPGMLSGLFKRKDKKGKSVGMDSVDSDAEGTSKQSEEYGRESPQSKPSDELSLERTSSEQSGPPSRQASKGKLQKPQRGRDDSPTKVKGILKMDTPEPLAVQPAAQETGVDVPATQATSTMRIVPAEEQDEGHKTSIVEERASSPEKPSPLNSAAAKLNPLNIVRSTPSGEPKPEKVRKAKQRVQLDDFDSEDEAKDPFADPDMQTHPVQNDELEPGSIGRSSEPLPHVSTADANSLTKGKVSLRKAPEPDLQHPPGLTGDTSSQETNSPVSTPTPEDSPTMSQSNNPAVHTARTSTEGNVAEPTSTSSVPPPSRPAPIPEKTTEASPPASSESTTLPAWSDHSLRTYLDDGSDIRDMLLVINDTTGVVPVGPDHPIMASLFVEETKTVSGLSSQLDNLLSGLLEKRGNKSKRQSPVAAVGAR